MGSKPNPRLGKTAILNIYRTGIVFKNAIKQNKKLQIGFCKTTQQRNKKRKGITRIAVRQDF
tara:strand:+ start:883 stop:1068 length:186 start_codon:yes stop_codon:yes gene_type:complete